MSWSTRNPGYSILPYARQIGRLVFETNARNLLDYGCGAKKQYWNEGVDRVWGIMPNFYDPNSLEHKHWPTGLYDGVICTDVLHYVAAEKLDHVVGHLVSLTRMWCFVTVRCRPGEGMITIRPIDWWQNKLLQAFGSRARVILEEMP